MTDYTDLIAKLRMQSASFISPDQCGFSDGILEFKAADAIESLQRENARLQCDYDDLDAENRALADYKAVDEMRSRKDWRISTLKRMQDKRVCEFCGQDYDPDGIIHTWHGKEICGPCLAPRNYPDSIGGDVMPDLPNGAKGFT